MFEEGIETMVPKEEASDVCKRVPATFLHWCRHTRGLNPKSNRTHHVLADPEVDHGLFVIGEEVWIVG